MEAREHQQTANALLLESKKEKDPVRKKELEQQSKTERSVYIAVKRSRWSLLTNSRNLTEDAENAQEQILQEKYRDHALTNSRNYKEMWECHIEPDWLLVYKVLKETLILRLIRTGIHSDLF